MIWVVNSDSNKCRIYQYDKHHAKLNLVKELQHPENKLHDRDLVSDRPGHYKSSGSSHGAFSQETDPKEIKIDAFYREIANELKLAREQNHFDKLIIIAAPHMNGLLYQHLDKHVKNLVTNNIQKDLVHLTDLELRDFLKENI